jgi:Fuc2NAc and GlcNAc transferase
MGDSGSIFLGYVFAGLFFLSIRHYEVSIWQWFIITGYYLGDTVTTFTIRFIKVKKWYGAHRSHAYQNLARIKGSHKKATFGVILYCVLWISPLLVISSYYPYLEIAIAVLAIIPSVVFSLKYGPLYSSS